MEIKEFIENFAEQFDDTPMTEFKPDTKFHDLEEYCSIVALSIIGMIDEEYDVTIKAAEVSEAVTIEDLFNVVKSKL